MCPAEAVAPNTRKMFKMLDPTRLPMLNAPFPRNAAVKEATISGTLVPNATTVTPTTWVLMPQLRAMSCAPAMKASEPKYSPTHPIVRSATNTP